jgi:hypothetical protein
MRTSRTRSVSTPHSSGSSETPNGDVDLGDVELAPESDIAQPGVGGLQVALEKRRWPQVLPGRKALLRDAPP